MNIEHTIIIITACTMHCLVCCVILGVSGLADDPEVQKFTIKRKGRTSPLIIKGLD